MVVRPWTDTSFSRPLKSKTGRHVFAPLQRNWRLSRKAARTYPKTYLGAAESNFGPDQGVLEKRIP